MAARAWGRGLSPSDDRAMDLPAWRCFVALPVPKAVAQEIEERCGALPDAWPEARWVPRGDLHLTLAFMGATLVDRLPAVEAALGEVARSVAPFEIALQGAGAFGGRGRPRVAWLGIGNGRTAVHDLAAACGSALAMEPGPASRPHLTVARRAPISLATTLGERFADGRPAWTGLSARPLPQPPGAPAVAVRGPGRLDLRPPGWLAPPGRAG